METVKFKNLKTGGTEEVLASNEFLIARFRKSNVHQEIGAKPVKNDAEAEAKAKAKEEADAKAKEEADAKAKADAEAKSKAEAEKKATAETKKSEESK